MKKTVWIATFVLLSASVVAERIGSNRRSVDDPPPEPVTCPLCGGNAQLHAVRMLGIGDAAAKAATLALRW